MSRASCRPCRSGDHDHCTGDVYDPDTKDQAFCGCSPAHSAKPCVHCGQPRSHEWDCPDSPVMIEKRRQSKTRARWDDPYARGKAEDAELDRRIGERFRP